MKNLFVPYPIAVIAKEKGFNEPCIVGYDSSDETPELQPLVNERGILSGVEPKYFDKSCVCAPLYCQLVDWFREKHRIFIAENIKKSIKYSCYIFEVYDLNTCKNESGSDNYHTVLKNAIEEAFRLI